MDSTSGNTLGVNPFHALFASVDKAEQFCEASKQSFLSQPSQINSTQEIIEENDLLERVFLVTVDRDFPNKEKPAEYAMYASFIEEYAGDMPMLQVSDLGHVILERLLMTNIKDKVLVCKGRNVYTKLSHATDLNPISYLFACYCRAESEKSDNSLKLIKCVEQSQSLIVQHIALCLLQPDIFSTRNAATFDVHMEFLSQLQENCVGSPDATYQSYLKQIASFLAETYPDDFEKAFSPIYKALLDSIKSPDVTIEDGDVINCLNVLIMWTSVKLTGLSFLGYHFPHSNPTLQSPATLLDLLLTKSCLITNPSNNNFRYFNDITSLHQSKTDDEESHMHDVLNIFYSKLCQIFLNLLRFNECKTKLLTWLGDVFNYHSAAGKIWMHENSNPLKSVFPSDALFINLSAVLVQLAQPFCVALSPEVAGKSNQTFLKIDPTYCLATSRSDRLERSVHMHSLAKETCIVSSPDTSSSGSTTNEVASSYGFVTECFLFTHTALHLGMHGLLEKFYRLNRELGKLQDLYRDVMQQGATADEAAMVKSTFERAMAVYLTSKATLCEPGFVENFSKFHVTTACFLIQCAHTDDRSKIYEANLDIEGPSPNSLKIMPEYIIENTTDFLLFLKRFTPVSFSNFNGAFDKLYLYATIFMGHKARITNPHLRASFAEVLEAILPIKEMDVDVGTREVSFEKFRFVQSLMKSVVRLFIDIEFTGDPHQFEQKFNYRKSLYKIMKFLWSDPRARQAITDSATDAITNIESRAAPLFLRFINLFLNDTIFLLDEAIGYMKQIKTLEQERDEGQWNELTSQERRQKEHSLKEFIMVARFHNVMSNETIDALAYLSEDIEVIKLLCRAVLIMRIATMLNDFLLRLVGSSMGELKVKDFSSCEFKPQELVVGICEIYVHLSQNGDFAKAVASDERSYKPDLFPRALRALRKTNRLELVKGVKEFSDEVRICQNRIETEEELFLDAPEEFLDALLYTVMTDPVVLPSSKMTVDRSTIARHLLSDNTDPFSRMPLKLEEVVDNTDLAQKIQQWKTDKA